MSTDTKEARMSADVIADLEYAAQLAATGQKDPAFAERIAKEAAKIREDVKKRFGLLDLGVPAIRELRDS